MWRILTGVFLSSAASLAQAAGGEVVGENLLWLAAILMAARIFAPLASRAGFPAVLGELLLGVALGNLSLLGLHYFEAIADDSVIAFLGERTAERSRPLSFWRM